MKKLNSFVSIILAIVLALGMSFSVLASDVDTSGEGGNNDETTDTTTTQTISFTNTTENHTYLIYQIFTGDVAGKELQNIQWGSDVLASFIATQDSAGVYAASLAEKDGEAAAAELVESVIDTSSISVITVTGTEIEGGGYSYADQTVAPGYYLVIDSDNGDPLEDKDDAYSAYILKLVTDITVTPKTNIPSVVKKVKDTNDSTGVTTDWQDSADYDIGDTISYKLTATLGDDNLDKYETYYLQFVDTLSKGLTFNSDSVVVKVDGATVSATNAEGSVNYVVVSTPNDEGTTTVTVTFTDVKTLGATNSSVITVEYTAKLNENAVIGEAGNPNTVKLIFSNNPDNSGGGEDRGETPEDKVIVFTYKLDVDKIDGTTGDALKGASFALYKITGVSDSTIGDATVTYDEEKAEATIAGVTGAELKAVDIDSTTEGQTNFGFSGIDDGYYVLIETETPAGYNTIDPVIFEVSATHDTDSADPKLTALQGTDVNSEIKFTARKTDGTLATDIENNSGSTLPETGGMGTKIFYTLGGILVIAAAVLLITKRRMSER